MRQQIINRPKLSNQLHRRLLPHTTATRNVVRRVTHQAQQVDDLRGTLDAILVAHLTHTHLLETARMARTIHEHTVADQLAVILVRRRHQHLHIRLRHRTARKRANDIVRLVARNLQHRNTHRLQNLLHQRNGSADVLRRLLTLRLIRRIRLVAECAPVRVERNGYMRRRQTTLQIVQRRDKTKHRRQILTTRIDTRRTNKSIIGAIDHRIGIDKKKHGELRIKNYEL